MNSKKLLKPSKLTYLARKKGESNITYDLEDPIVTLLRLHVTQKLCYKSTFYDLGSLTIHKLISYFEVIKANH